MVAAVLRLQLSNLGMCILQLLMSGTIKIGVKCSSNSGKDIKMAIPISRYHSFLSTTQATRNMAEVGVVQLITVCMKSDQRALPATS
jgi:hypothetical protein